jgi:hypothetical protein
MQATTAGAPPPRRRPPHPPSSHRARHMEPHTTPCRRRTVGARLHRHTEGAPPTEKAPPPPSKPGLCPSVTSSGGGRRRGRWGRALEVPARVSTADEALTN